MNLPRISVVIPTYNRSNKLGEAIISIEQGTYPKKRIEILVVDDCSTDNTKQVVEQLIKKYKNIRYFRTKKNSGPAVARNIGIKHSKGEYVFFTDDDCVVSRNALVKYVTFLEKNGKVMGAGGLLVPASNNIIAKIEAIKDRILKISDKSLRVGRNVPVGFTCNMIYRRKVFKEVGYFNEKFKAPAGEDTELKNRVVKKYDLAVMPVIVKHNHDYNLDYLLGILFKQSLGRNPPSSTIKKIFYLILYSPKLIYKVVTKTLVYRRDYK